MAENYRVERWVEPNSPNSAMLRMQLEAGGYQVFQWSDRPGTYYGTHKHPEAQSHWVISGSIEIVVHSCTYVLNAGDRDFMPAETYHTARVIGDEPVTYLIGEMPPPAPPKKKRGRPRKKQPEPIASDEEAPDYLKLLRMIGK